MRGGEAGRTGGRLTEDRESTSCEEGWQSHLTWFVELPQLTLRGHHKGPHCPFATRLFLSWR